MAQARFWIWWNDGFVRLKLNPGQSVVAWRGGPTDEGYSRTVETYAYDGAIVSRTIEEDGRDCDGRHEYFWEGFCEFTLLKSRAAEGEIFGVPAWEETCKGQRDHFAEAMGY